MTLPDLNSRIYTLKDSVLSFELSGLSMISRDEHNKTFE